MKEQEGRESGNPWYTKTTKGAELIGNDVKVESYREGSKFWGWVFTRKDTVVKNVGAEGLDSHVGLEGDNPAAILMFENGMVEIFGKDGFGENVEEQRELYKDGIALMQLNGIETPKPNSKYTKAESLIWENLLDPKSAVSPDSLRKGDLILVADLDSGEFTRRTRDMVCVGAIEDISEYGIFRNRYISLRNPSWFIPFEPFVPGTKHNILGVTNYDGKPLSSKIGEKKGGSEEYDLLADFGLNGEDLKRLRQMPVHKANKDLLEELQRIAPSSE